MTRFSYFGQPMQFFYFDPKTSTYLPNTGGRIYTYEAGSTIPCASFSDANHSIVHPNPLILDADGKAPIWLSHGQLYRIVVYTAADSIVEQFDQIAAQ